MAEQDLNRTNIRARFQELGRKRMAERMDRDGLSKARGQDGFATGAVDRPGIDGAAVRPREQPGTRLLSLPIRAEHNKGIFRIN